MSGVKIPFTADVRGYNKGIAEMRGKYKEFGDYVKKNRGLIALSVGAAGIAAFSRGMSKAIDKASKISDMAKEAKINVEGLQVALLLGKDEGAAQEQVVAALKNLSARTIDAANGATNYQLALKRLNIDLDTFLNLNTEKKLIEIARGYMKTGEDAQAYRDILTILGEDAGPKMIGVLQRMGADGFDQLNKKMKESSKILKSDVIDSLKATHKAAQSMMDFIIGGISTGYGKIALLAGFGNKEDVQAMGSATADMLSFGAFDFQGKDAKNAEAEEDRQGRLRRDIKEQNKIIDSTTSAISDRELLMKESDRILADLSRGKMVSSSVLNESREDRLKRIKQEEKVKQDNDGIIAEGPKMAPDMTKKRQSFQSAVASIPVSSLQAVGGGDTISSSAASQIQVLRSQESLLRMIAENTNGLKESAGPMQKGAPLT